MPHVIETSMVFRYFAVQQKSASIFTVLCDPATLDVGHAGYGAYRLGQL